MSEGDPIYRKNEEFIWSELEGEAVLLNVKSGDYFSLNDTGLAFWEKVDGDRPLSKIVEMMFEEYDVPLTVLRQDIGELAQEMSCKGLLETRE